MSLLPGTKGYIESRTDTWISIKYRLLNISHCASFLPSRRLASMIHYYQSTTTKMPIAIEPIVTEPIINEPPFLAPPIRVSPPTNTIPVLVTNAATGQGNSESAASSEDDSFMGDWWPCLIPLMFFALCMLLFLFAFIRFHVERCKSRRYDTRRSWFRLPSKFRRSHSRDAGTRAPDRRWYHLRSTVRLNTKDLGPQSSSRHHVEDVEFQKPNHDPELPSYEDSTRSN